MANTYQIDDDEILVIAGLISKITDLAEKNGSPAALQSAEFYNSLMRKLAKQYMHYHDGLDLELVYREARLKASRFVS